MVHVGADGSTTMPVLEVTLAGAVSLRRGDLRVGDRGFGARQLRLVTAILVVERSDPVSVDRLAAEVWPATPPDQWRAALRGLVSQVRRRLVDVGLDPDAVVGEHGRYVVQLGDVRVDVEQADADVVVARQALEAGEVERARELASSARSVLSRPVLSGVDSPWLDRWRDRLAGRHLESLVVLGECRSRAGAHGQARSVLAEAVELDPLREDAWRALMLAEVAAGNAARALQAYEECRRHLADELGVDPGAATQQLHAEILRGVPEPVPDQQPTSTDLPEVAVGPPYVGLRAFRFEDAGLFFGRDAEVQALVDRLVRHGIVAVVGPSGVGKSSLVRAGLLPALARGAIPDSDTWTTVVMAPGAQPLKHLAAELEALGVASSGSDLLDRLATDPEALHELAGEALADDPPTARVVLVVDQFEELFTLGSRAQAEQVSALLEAATARLDRRVSVVVTLRADFYDRAAEVAGIADLLSHSQFVVPPLQGEQVEAAVVGPARHAGVTLEPGLLGRIATDVAGEAGALPLLQHLLYELWERRVDRVLTRGAYHDLGGVAGALAHRAEEVYGSLDRDERAVARRVLLRAVQPGEDGADTRRPVSEAELLGPSEDPDLVRSVLARLVDARLLTASQDPDTGGRTLELAHEALVDGWPRLRAWVDEARGWLLDHRRLTAAAAEWVRHGRHDDWLLAGLQLDEAHDLLLADGRGDVDLHLSPAEHELVQASLDARELVLAWEADRQQERLDLERRSTVRARALVAVVTVVALVAGGLWWTSSREARAAHARELLGHAEQVVDEDPELGILIALEALDAGGAEHAVASMLRAGILHQRAATMRTEVGEVIGWSTGAAFVATARDERGPSGWDVDIRDGTTGDVIQTLPGHPGSGSVWSADWSDDSSVVAVGTRDGSIHLWDWRTGGDIARVQGAPDEIVTDVDLHPDGGLVAGVWQPSELVAHAQVLDVRGTLVREFPLLDPEDPSTRPLVVRFSPDGRRLALLHPGRGLVRVVGTDDWSDEYEVEQFGAAGIGWSPDGRWLAVAGAETVLVDASTGTVVHELRGPSEARGDVAWSTESDQVAVAGEPSMVWNIEDADAGEALEPIVLAGVVLDQPRLAFGDQDLLHEGSNSGEGMRTWDLGNRTRSEVAWLPGGVFQMGVDWSPDGLRLATSAGGGDLAIWDRESWEPYSMIDAHEAVPVLGLESAFAEIPNLDWSPDGSRIATAGFDDVAVWDPEAGRALHRVDTGQSYSSVAYGPEGDHLAVSADAKGILVVDRAGAVVTTIVDDEGTVVEDLRFSPDGRFLATARITPQGATGPLNETRIWDWEQGVVAASLDSAPANVHWDGSGRRLLVASQPVQLWDVATLGQADAPVIGEADGDVVLELHGHTAWVQEAVFSPDERWVATCSGDGTARLWDVATGREVQRLVADGLSGFCRLRFSPDGGLLALSDGGNGVRVLTLDVDHLADLAASKLTRGLSDDECREYLDVDACPG